MLNSENASQAIEEGLMGGAVKASSIASSPRRPYFYPENGKRTAFFVFNMEGPSQIPPVTEPLFQTAAAEVVITPVMDRNDLQAGLREVSAG